MTLMLRRMLLAGLFSGVLALGASDVAERVVYHATTPAGYDVLTLKPSGAILTLLGLIECAELEGAQQTSQGVKATLLAADGKLLDHFPGKFSFRVTASLQKNLLVTPGNVVNITEEPQEMLLGLRFRLKIYHALEAREVQPQSVQMLGVPADIPYDERIDRVNFAVTDVLVTDRCVLEVLSPKGSG